MESGVKCLQHNLQSKAPGSRAILAIDSSQTPSVWMHTRYICIHLEADLSQLALGDRTLGNWTRVIHRSRSLRLIDCDAEDQTGLSMKEARHNDLLDM